MKIFLLLGGVLAVGLLAATVYVVSTTEPAAEVSHTQQLGAQNSAALNQIQTTGELKITDIEEGEGTEAQPGQTVVVHYVGTLVNGQEFDNSVKREKPLIFRIGAGQVVPGFEQGVNGMKVGGTRKIIIPPALGYGDKEQGPIPAGSTLIFEVKLLDAK